MMQAVGRMGVGGRRRYVQPEELAKEAFALLYGTMGTGKDVDFWRALRWPGIFWYSWALLTPLVFALAQRYRLGEDRKLRRLGMLVLGCGLFMMFHVALHVLAILLPAYHDAHVNFADAVSYHLFGTINTNVVTYALLVGAWEGGS